MTYFVYMTIREKIDLECSGELGVIHLHREGIFFRAYELSAYYWHRLVVPNFRLHKRYYKTIGQEVVYLGFPTLS